MIDDIYKLLEKIYSVEWLTKKGLVVYTSAAFCLAFILLNSFKSIGITFHTSEVIAIILIFLSLHIIIWILYRNYPYNIEDLNIAFAIKIEENSQNYYREIKKRFRSVIDDQKLSDEVRIIELPSDLNFIGQSSAQNFIEKRGIRIMLWGNASEGFYKGSPLTQFNIKVSYQYFATTRRQKEATESTINDAVQRGIWKVWKPNSHFELLIVTGNILEISLFTLGACLASVPNTRHLEKAVLILEKLEKLIHDRKQDLNFPNLELIKNKLKNLTIEVYSSLGLISWLIDKNLESARDYTLKTLEIDGDHFFAHQNLAMYEWKLGNQSSARAHTEKAARLRPGHALPRFNKAFLHIYDGEYKEGLLIYKKIKNAGGALILPLIDFIESEYDKKRSNLGLLFVIGWLNVQFADNIRGINILKIFCSLANENKYDCLIKEAKKYLPLK
jgi:hypothetical protein